jgi:hypothetical protein
MSQAMLRSMAVAAVAALLVFALATQRTLHRGAEEMRASDQAFDAGQLQSAVRHARRAASLYVPGASHVDEGYDRLKAVAVGAERARDTGLAMAAWRAVRAATLESRHLWLGRPRELTQANANLARLSGVPDSSTPELQHLADGAGALRASLGFVAALAGLLLIARYGVARSGEMTWVRARAPACLLAAGLVSLALAWLRA